MGCHAVSSGRFTSGTSFLTSRLKADFLLFLWSMKPRIPSSSSPCSAGRSFSLYPYYHNLIIFLSSLLQLPAPYSYICVNISFEPVFLEEKNSLFIRKCSWTTGFFASFWLYKARGGRQCSAFSFQLKSPCHLAVEIAAEASHLLYSGDNDGSGRMVCLFI